MPPSIRPLSRGVHPATVRGLLHGKVVQHGNKCVDKGKRPRTKRDWQPNIRYKFLYSEALGRRLRLFVTPDTLKRIDRAGGLDMYLLTNTVASEGSLVGAELRKVVAAAYQAKGLQFPKKEGPTSILSIVREHLSSAGLRPPLPRQGSKAPPVSPSRPLTRSAASQPDPSLQPAQRPAAEGGSHSAGVAPQVASPPAPPLTQRYVDHPTALLTPTPTDAFLVPEPYPEVLRHATSPRGGVRVEKPRAQLKVDWGLRQRRSLRLRCGKRLKQHVREAVLRAKRTQRARVRRRNSMLRTLRGMAHNELLRLRASDIRRPFVSAFARLEDFVASMHDPVQKAQWQVILERYKPTVPGMIIDGTFVPASSRHAGYAPPRATPAELAAAAEPSAEAAAAARLHALLREPEVRGFLRRQASPLAHHSWLQGTAAPPLLPGERESRAGRGGADSAPASPPTAPRTMRDVRLTGLQMRHSSRKKYMKMAKWLDDEWVRLHVAPQTDENKLVLPNQMVLWSTRRRRHWKPFGPLMPKATLEVSPNPLLPARDAGGTKLVLPDQIHLQGNRRDPVSTDGSVSRTLDPLPGVPNPLLDITRPRISRRRVVPGVWAWLAVQQPTVVSEWKAA